MRNAEKLFKAKVILYDTLLFEVSPDKMTKQEMELLKALHDDEQIKDLLRRTQKALQLTHSNISIVEHVKEED